MNPTTDSGFVTAGRVRKLNTPYDLRKITRMALSRMTDEGGYVIEPFMARNAILMPEHEFVLAHWGMYNPLGPTLEFLLMGEAADGEGGLLYKQMMNPFGSWAVVYGILPETAYSNEEQVLETLRDIFAENGAPGFELFRHFPTYVFGDFSQSPICEEDLRDMVYAAGQQVEIDDLSYACDLYEMFPAKPQERSESVSTLAPSRRSAFCPHAPSEAEFARWWRVVTAKAHVDAEAKTSLKAWEDCIHEQYMSGNLSRLTVTNWSDVMWFLESVKWK